MNLNIYIYVGMDKPTSTARWGITSCIMENCIIQVFQRQKYRSGGSVSKVSTLISIPPMTLQPVTLRYMRPCVGQIGTAYHQLLVLSIFTRGPEMIFPFCRTVFASRPGTFWNQISKSSFPVIPSCSLRLLWSPLHHPDHWSNTSVFKGKVPTASIIFEQNRPGFKKQCHVSENHGEIRKCKILKSELSQVKVWQCGFIFKKIKKARPLFCYRQNHNS